MEHDTDDPILYVVQELVYLLIIFSALLYILLLIFFMLLHKGNNVRKPNYVSTICWHESSYQLWSIRQLYISERNPTITDHQSTSGGSLGCSPKSPILPKTYYIQTKMYIVFAISKLFKKCMHDSFKFNLLNARCLGCG